MLYDMLFGHIGLYDESIQLNSMKEVADFIHTHDCGYSQKQTALRFWNLRIARSTNAPICDSEMSSWQNSAKAKALKTVTVGNEIGEPMNYFDKNGNQIKSGMDIRMEDGSTERVYETTDAYGNPDLGISASNEAYLERHPYADREYYSLCNFDLRKVEIVEQTETLGMNMCGM